MNDLPCDVEPQSVPGVGQRAPQAESLAEIERVTGASFRLTEALRTSRWRALSSPVSREANACYRQAVALHWALLAIAERIESEGAP